MADVQAWSADVLISAPVPIDQTRPALVDLGGFAWSAGGITHNLNEGDIEELLIPTWMPDLSTEEGRF